MVIKTDIAIWKVMWINILVFDVGMNVLNGKTWKDLDGNDVSDKITFTYGDHFSVVAYAVADDDSSCPIANFNCRFFGFHPMMDSEMGNDEIQRKISYLEENYNRVAMVSFDNDSPEQTLSAPTNDMDNQSEHPSDWSKRNYGFVYKSLLSKVHNLVQRIMTQCIHHCMVNMESIRRLMCREYQLIVISICGIIRIQCYMTEPGN